MPEHLCTAERGQSVKQIQIYGTDLSVSCVAQGCMRIAGLGEQALDTLIRSDLERGINFFDHADIYGGGACETLFGKVLHADPSLRDHMIIQTKCGIRSGSYDFSPDYIRSCVEGSLRRLGIDRLDLLLLHRPDTLMEPEEVAGVFEALHREGKVRYFGVSNHNPMQIELLNRFLGQRRIVVNQLQFSPANTTMIASGLNVNMENDAAVNRDGSVLDYCRLNRITIQPWSPFQYGFFGGCYIGNEEKYGPLNRALEKVAEQYGITPTGAAIAWILRHPAKMQPVVGTVNSGRLDEICAGAETVITHQEWYDIFRAAGNRLP